MTDPILMDGKSRSLAICLWHDGVPGLVKSYTGSRGVILSASYDEKAGNYFALLIDGGMTFGLCRNRERFELLEVYGETFSDLRDLQKTMDGIMRELGIREVEYPPEYFE